MEVDIAPEGEQNVSRESKLTSAAKLLLASRMKPGASGGALIAALGQNALITNGTKLEAMGRSLVQPYPPAASQSAVEPVVVEAAGRTTNLLRSITELGDMVRAARKTMKMNQADFAAHAGVGRRFVSELEGGKPSLEFDKVLACAAAAGIDLLAKARRG